MTRPDLRVKFDPDEHQIKVSIPDLAIEISLTDVQAQILSLGLARAVSEARALAKSKSDRNAPVHPECAGKRCYPSEAAAKLHNKKAGWRFRTYLCGDCNAWHVTNADKAKSRKAVKNQGRKVDE